MNDFPKDSDALKNNYYFEVFLEVKLGFNYVKIELCQVKRMN